MLNIWRRIALAAAYARYERNIAQSLETKTKRLHGLIANGTDSVEAYQLAHLEQLCNDRLWLPVQGLERIKKELEAEGFWFDPQPRSKLFIGCLFSKGWQLVPDGVSVCNAMLIDPLKHERASIFYKATPHDTRAFIC